MAQFSVPQFIEFESKIVGPLTLRQFAFIGVPSLASFFLFFIFSLPVWIFASIILISVGVAFAFIKIGGRPLYHVALHGFRFFWQPKLYLWRAPVIEQKINIPTIQRKRQDLKELLPDISKLGRLWQDLTTTKNPIPKREKQVPRKSLGEIREQFQVFRKITGEKEVARRVDYR
jgi:hypothetical protein